MKLAIDETKQEVKSDMPREEMQEYVKLTRELGIINPAARLEEFKAFLSENNITVYPKERVDEYLREKSFKEGGERCYWVWKPLRAKDQSRLKAAAPATNSSMGTFITFGWDDVNAFEVVPALPPVRTDDVNAFEVVPALPPVRTVIDPPQGPGATRFSELQRRLSSLRQTPMSPRAFVRQRQSIEAEMEKIGTRRAVPDRGHHASLQHGTLAVDIYRHSIPLPVLMTMKTIATAFPDAQFFASDYAVQRPDPFLAVTLPEIDELFIIERWDEPAFRF